MSQGVTIRRAVVADLDTICGQREAIFLGSGRSQEVVSRFSAPSRAWHAERLADGRYRGWLAEEDGKPIGGVGLHLLDWAPGPSHAETDRRGLVLNVWVDPGHRGRGIAKALMRELESEARRLGVFYLVLHATDAGRPLYESMNWQATNEMSLTLNP